MIVSVSKIYYAATINVGIAPAGRCTTLVSTTGNCACYRVEAWSTQIRGRSSADAERLGDLGDAELAGNVTTVSPRTRSARREWKRVLDQSVLRNGRPVPDNQCARSRASRTDRGTLPRGLGPCRRTLLDSDYRSWHRASLGCVSCRGGPSLASPTPNTAAARLFICAADPDGFGLSPCQPHRCGELP